MNKYRLEIAKREIILKSFYTRVEFFFAPVSLLLLRLSPINLSLDGIKKRDNYFFTFLRILIS